MTTWAMFDLETLATDPAAQVLTIGAVKFDPFSFKDTHSEFYYRFNIDEQDQLDRTQNPDTLTWWGEQSVAAQEEAFHPDRTDCREILWAFKKWYVGCDGIWSQGSFDVNIMENMYRQFDIPIPWAHWQVGDSRSLLKRMPQDPRYDNKFVAHDALADAKAQVDALRKTFKHFNMTK